VRNTCYTWLRRNRAHEMTTELDPAQHALDPEPNPEELQLRKAGAESLRKALEELPAEFREVLVLRELEGMSYKQLARTMEIPIGTVMSRLPHAPRRLLETLRRDEAGATA
jgi:RNA polymerase sigma factor (sigma-70 family)